MSTHKGEISTASLDRANFSMGHYIWLQFAVIIIIAFGNASTMPLGPDFRELGHFFGYDPSWTGVNLLFILFGFMLMRSFEHSGNVLSVLKNRARALLPPLIAYAIIVTCIIYPLVGVPHDTYGNAFSDLGSYFIAIITCYNPAKPLPGLLDDAIYGCIIQGAIWTFRWGALALLGSGLAYSLGLLKRKQTLLLAALLATTLYALIHGFAVYETYAVPSALLAPLRLAAMFMIGAAGYGYRHSIPKQWALAPILLALCAGQFYLMRWTPFIEISLAIFLGYCAFLIIHPSGNTSVQTETVSKLSTLPRGLTASLYIFHWPIAQLLLLNLPDIGSFALTGLTLLICIPFSYGLALILQKLISKASNREALEGINAK